MSLFDSIKTRLSEPNLDRAILESLRSIERSQWLSLDILTRGEQIREQQYVKQYTLDRALLGVNDFNSEVLQTAMSQELQIDMIIAHTKYDVDMKLTVYAGELSDTDPLRRHVPVASYVLGANQHSLILAFPRPYCIQPGLPLSYIYQSVAAGSHESGYITIIGSLFDHEAYKRYYYDNIGR